MKFRFTGSLSFTRHPFLLSFCSLCLCQISPGWCFAVIRFPNAFQCFATLVSFVGCKPIYTSEGPLLIKKSNDFFDFCFCYINITKTYLPFIAKFFFKGLCILSATAFSNGSPVCVILICICYFCSNSTYA